MKSLLKPTLLAAVGVAFAASSAMGAFTFTNGDLILGFQATGGQGAGQNVFFNLGSGTYHRDNPGSLYSPTLGNNPFGTTGQTFIGDISDTLEATYGANWFSRTDLWFGVVGNLNLQPTSGIGSRTPVDGDPSRTFYVSAPTSTVGGGVLYPAGTYPSASLGTAGQALSGMEGFLPTLTDLPDGAAVLDQATQPVQWNNGWTVWNPTPGGAFGTFSGGIQQHFGNGIARVDLQRVLATNTGASPTGVVGGGTYETTFMINSLGQVSSIPEPTSALLGSLGVLALLRRRRSA